MACDTVDVLIVGVGPAGCAAALAVRGMVGDAMLCASEPERRDLAPRRMETVGPAVLSAAGGLGILHCFASAKVGSVETFIRDGRAAELGEPANDEAAEHWHVDRNRLDAALRSAAHNSGVATTRARLTRVRPNSERLDCSFADGRAVTCRLLIDATGQTRGAIPRQRELLSPPLLVSTGAIPADGKDAENAATRFSSRPWGWVWSTGKCGDELGWTALAGAGRPRPTEITVLIDRSRPYSVAHSSATWQVNLHRHARILPVGDAAGSLDPASGLGLANALATAISAADVARSLSRGSVAVEREAASYHERRIALLLCQADELSRRYAETGILQADPMEAASAV